MKKTQIWQAFAATTIAVAAGCNTVTIRCPQAGANVRCGDQYGPAPMEVETAWRGSAKQATVSKEGYASKSISVNYESSRVVNVWAFLLSGLVVVIAVGSFFIKK